MTNELELNESINNKVLICDKLCIATKRPKVTCMWKIIFVECRPVGGRWGVLRDPNAIAAQRAARFFSYTCPKIRGAKHVKV